MYKKIAVFIVLLLWGAGQAQACTLWGSAGSMFTADGGTMLAKNRDWRPDHVQTIEVITPTDGYRFIALIAKGNSYGGVKAGINEYGLAAVSSSASTISLSVRQKLPHYRGGTLASILRNCRTVEEALKHSEYFIGVQNIMLADHDKIALIEIAPEGIYRIKDCDSGVLYHTNHYVDADLQWANYRSPGVSSVARYQRIGELMSPIRLYSLEDFIKFSEDVAAGPDNSVWRTGITPKATRTLATWIVRIPQEGSPVIYVKLANPGEKETTYNINVKEVFHNLKNKI